MKQESLNPASIPAELKTSSRWVRGALCDVKQPDGSVRKLCKPPFNSRTGEHASHSDPHTWSSYDATIEAHNANAPLKPNNSVVTMHEARYIGVVCGKPWVFGDIDHCIENGVITDPVITAWVEELNTYTEISPSGSGLRFVLHGEPPYTEGHRKDRIEIYSTKRWVTLTGNVLPGHEEIRRADEAEIRKIYERVKAGRSTPRVEGQPVADSATRVAKLQELMTRTDFPDLSQAVQSLFTALAYQNCDPNFIDAEFRKSKLFLETHWSEKFNRPDLHDSQIAKAIAWVKEHPRREGPIITLDETGDDEVVMKPLRYAWEPVLPLGKLVHFGGASSQGKSPVTVDLIARVSRGVEFPNGAKNGFSRPRRSILFNIEDGLEDTILPRYYLAGGVRGMLRHIKGVKIANGESLRNGLVALDRDIHLICERARQIEDLGLIVLDPITNYLGKMDMNAEGDVRNILTPLAGIAEELDIVVITVGHLNKSQGNDALQRMMGATAFSGVARSVYIFGPDQNSESPYRHVMSPLRGEMHDSLVYLTEVVKHQFEAGVEGKVVKVIWDGTTKQTGEDTTDTPVSKRQLSRAQEAGEDLRKFLLAGKRSAKDCTEYLRLNGFDLEKLNASTVRKYAGAITDYDRKKGVSMWYLPTNASLFEPSPEREKRSEEIKQDDAPDY
jgi:hypothetical protein